MYLTDSKPMRKMDFQEGTIFSFSSEKSQENTGLMMIVKIHRESNTFEAVPFNEIPSHYNLNKAIKSLPQDEPLKNPIEIDGIKVQDGSSEYFDIPKNSQKFTIEDFSLQPWEKDQVLCNCEHFLEKNKLSNYRFYEHLPIYSLDYQVEDEYHKRTLYFIDEYNSHFEDLVRKTKLELKRKNNS